MKKDEAKLTNKADNKVTILGVKVTGTELVEVLGKIRQNWVKRHKFLIVTPNPEILLMARRDRQLKDILNGADISIPDGVGMGLKPIHGRKLFIELLKERKRFFLLGGPAPVTIRAARALGVDGVDGPQFDQSGRPLTKKDEQLERKVIQVINKAQPDLLFVGFGAPKQEKWLARNWGKLDIGGAMVVGRTFEYYAGRFPLPPQWIEKLELEWLWRLLTGSTNIKRIVRAIIIFPLISLYERFAHRRARV